MFCPVCGSEYVDGFDTCRFCKVSLVSQPPAPRSDRTPEGDAPVLVTVFSSSHEEPIAVAQSILRSASVPFFVRGETIKDLFGYGRFPLGRSVTLGPMEIVVLARDAEDAQALLQGVAKPETAGEDGSEAGGGRTAWSVAARVVAAVMLLYLLGPIVGLLIASLFD